jgi:hypothetical protein
VRRIETTTINNAQRAPLAQLRQPQLAVFSGTGLKSIFQNKSKHWLFRA